jgi:hypothetical protein
VVLRGTVLAGSAAAFAASTSHAAGPITVTVEGVPGATATVSGDGSFSLRGLPEGTFTLVFTQDGATLGTLAFAEVKPNQEITITVRVDGGSVVLVEEKRNGIGHGDVEIEGLVASVLALNPAGESRFLIASHTVVARPGQTAIREGNRTRAVSDVTPGRRVHVKGVWLPAESGGQPVLAHEIKLQGSDQDDVPPPSQSCMISGGRVNERIELEGSVIGGSASGFTLRLQGNRASGPVQVETGGSSFECHPANGPNAPTPEQCRARVASGAKVHVSGTLHSCDASSAVVRASKVMVQK